MVLKTSHNILGAVDILSEYQIAVSAVNAGGRTRFLNQISREAASALAKCQPVEHTVRGVDSGIANEKHRIINDPVKSGGTARILPIGKIRFKAQRGLDIRTRQKRLSLQIDMTTAVANRAEIDATAVERHAVNLTGSCIVSIVQNELRAVVYGERNVVQNVVSVGGEVVLNIRKGQSTGKDALFLTVLENERFSVRTADRHLANTRKEVAEHRITGRIDRERRVGIRKLNRAGTDLRTGSCFKRQVGICVGRAKRNRTGVPGSRITDCRRDQATRIDHKAAVTRQSARHMALAVLAIRYRQELIQRHLTGRFEVTDLIGTGIDELSAVTNRKRLGIAERLLVGGQDASHRRGNRIVVFTRERQIFASGHGERTSIPRAGNLGTEAAGFTDRQIADDVNRLQAVEHAEAVAGNEQTRPERADRNGAAAVLDVCTDGLERVAVRIRERNTADSSVVRNRRTADEAGRDEILERSRCRRAYEFLLVNRARGTGIRIQIYMNGTT